MGGHAKPDSNYPIQTMIKVPTHVKGLDGILKGGLPEGRMSAVMGGPGTGKTMLGLEICYRYAKSGKPSLMLTFEENDAMMRGNALSLGWDLAALERNGKLAVIHPALDPYALSAGDFDLNGLIAILEGKAREIGACLIVVDALDALLRIFEDPARQKHESNILARWLGEHKMTALLTLKLEQSQQALEKYGFIDYLSDCLLYLDQRVSGQVVTRRLRVIKYRGSEFSGNEHPFVITPQGFVLMPISETTLDHKPLGAMVSTGTDQLDDIMGGGFHQGSAVLIGGPTGSGKTTIVSQFTCAACARGERVTYVSFEESPETLMGAMQGLGIDLTPHLQTQLLKFHTVMPEAMGVEEHLYRISKIIDSFEPRHIIVDAVSAAIRMGSDKAAFDFMVRLMNDCKKKGMTCIYTNQTSSRTPVDEISGIGISSLIDTAIVLGFDRQDRELARTLLVLKSRGADHSHEIYGLSLSGSGIVLSDHERETGKDEE